MFNYLAFLDSGLEKSGENPIEDGKTLGFRCLNKLEQIDNPEQFPPKVLILLVSAGYLDVGPSLSKTRARHLISGIYHAFSEAGHDDILLIGSSVAAVCFDNKVYPEGALLVCLASRLLAVRVAVGPEVSADAEVAVARLLADLDLEHSLNEYPKPLPNRVLLSFFPSSGKIGAVARHTIDKLHRLLREKLSYQIPIVGGVSSAHDLSGKKRGLQFVGRQTFTDGLAACLILSGVPVGTSLANGLEPLRNPRHSVLHVKELSKDGKRIKRFYEGAPEELLNGASRPILLKDLSPGSDFIRAACLPDSNYKVVSVLREVREHAVLEVMTPTPKKMFEAARKSSLLSLQREGIKAPVGSLSIRSAGPYHYRDVLHLNIEGELADMRARLDDSPYVGGFFDGEAGTIETGNSECSNWGIAGIVFGDEVSERTAVQGGFAAMAEHGVGLSSSFELEEALDLSVRLVYDLGFPGAMISVLMPDQQEKRFIPMKAIGSRCERLLRAMRTDGMDDRILDRMEFNREAGFISDSRLERYSPVKAVGESGIISQYVMPLFDLEGRIFALLRIDLGDVRGESGIPTSVKNVLEPIASTVGAAINRVFNWEENRIARNLDDVLKRSLTDANLSEGLQYFLEVALDVFGLKMGHIRILDPNGDYLVLVAGVGPYYEAAKLFRSKVDLEDWSPSCDAFIEDKLTIINDAPNNALHKKMYDKYLDNSQMREVLQQVGSYANVPFKNEKGMRMGTIDLVSNRPWFFTSYHERALAALARRLGFLVEHLQAMRREAEVTNRIKFLLDVSPKLHQIASFDDIFGILEDATRSFCKAVNAECGSLYLWSEDRKQYILRAEYGWYFKGWINAARYEKDSDWIGSKGMMESPRYIPDLYRQYKGPNHIKSDIHHAFHIFGQHLLEDSTVEAIYVPLRVGDEPLGVLTLYHQANKAGKEQIIGFKITDRDLLQEGANHLAGLVKLLLSRQAVRFDQLAQKRRAEIYSVLAPKSDDKPFETGVCEKVLNTFNALYVDYYKLEELGSRSGLFWIDGARRDSVKDESQHRTQDAIIERTETTKTVQTVLRKLSDEQKADPKQAVTEGLIERACIPLLAAGQLVGILDLHWRMDDYPDYSLIGSRGEEELTVLGEMIGSAYWRHQLAVQQKQAEEEAERNRLAVQSVGAMVFQTAHRLSNLIQKIYRLSLSIKEAADESSRGHYINRLFDVVREAMDKINWPMDTAQRIQRASYERSNLRQLIEQVLEELGDFGPSIHTSLSVPDDLVVIVNPEHTKEAFLNLINNAVRAMNGKQEGRLRICAAKADKKMALIHIEDSGVGMTEGEIQSALRGFVSSQGHKGVGVLISSVLLHVQGGKLEFESTKGVGTKAIITLPLE